MKVVLDCNIVVSFLINPGENIRIIKEAWQKDHFQLLVSEEIMQEINLILNELEIKGYFGSKEKVTLIKLISRKGKTVNILSDLNISSDKKDNRYLNCAKDGKADYLVTGNRKHYPTQKKYKYSKILTPPEFSLILQSLPKRIN